MRREGAARARLGHGLVVAAAAVGVVLGLCAFTFRYAEGFSYFSTDPKACANCHIMHDQYDVLAKGPHHARRHAASTATCRTTFVPKYIAKASNG